MVTKNEEHYISNERNHLLIKTIYKKGFLRLVLKC